MTCGDRARFTPYGDVGAWCSSSSSHLWTIWRKISCITTVWRGLYLNQLLKRKGHHKSGVPKEKLWGEVWSFGTNSMQTGQTVILVWFPMHSNKNKKRKEATGLKNQPAFFVNSSKSSRVFFMGPPKKESECINESTITLTDIILSEIPKIQRSWFKRKKWHGRQGPASAPHVFLHLCSLESLMHLSIVKVSPGHNEFRWRNAPVEFVNLTWTTR